MRHVRIDAFALNMAYNDPTNIKALPAAFSAADNVGFKLLARTFKGRHKCLAFVKEV
jgi:hypothetical protein